MADVRMAEETYLVAVRWWRVSRTAALVTVAVILPGGLIALAIVALVRRLRARARLRAA
jgi:hypothetical protein